jgi:hypothetical protein
LAIDKTPAYCSVNESPTPPLRLKVAFRYFVPRKIPNLIACPSLTSLATQLHARAVREEKSKCKVSSNEICVKGGENMTFCEKLLSPNVDKPPTQVEK